MPDIKIQDASTVSLQPTDKIPIGRVGNNSPVAILGSEITNASRINVNVTGTSKTLALTDANTRQMCSNASTQTITIPLNASVAFVVDKTEIEVLREGVGLVNITATSGVTLNGTNAGTITIPSQYQGVFLIKRGTDAWIVSGYFV